MKARLKNLCAPLGLPLAVFLVGGLPGIARADVMQEAAWVDCDTNRNQLSVRYGRQSSAASDPKATVFWSLIRYSKRPDGDPDHVTDLVPAEKECSLNGGRYRVILEPVPMNYNLQAFCGAVVRGQVTILRDGREIVPATEFATGECSGPNKVIRQISVDGKSGKVLMEREEEQ